ncbi:hypothetical protein KCP73_19305 [Salmonella enterica subsp. enterica]|nr:hypothetical protein KCP73_19305 [Salmonella enterica subsp. enterica]
MPVGFKKTARMATGGSELTMRAAARTSSFCLALTGPVGLRYCKPEIRMVVMILRGGKAPTIARRIVVSSRKEMGGAGPSLR